MGFGFSELRLVFEGSTLLNAETWCAYNDKFHDTTDTAHFWLQERNMCSISLESPDMDDRLFLHQYINCQLGQTKLQLPQAVIELSLFLEIGQCKINGHFIF